MKNIIINLYRKTKRHIGYLRHKDALPNNNNNSDLFIVAFPKSGITWLSTIITNICYLENDISKTATHFNLEQFVGDIHQSRIIAENNIFPYHRIIKSHSEYNPYYRHVIYLLRNPFSVMNSYYHFAVGKKQYNGNILDFLKNDTFGVERWKRHVNSWVNPKKPLKLHLLKYEELIDYPEKTINNLCINLGWTIEDTKIKKALELSTFRNMKKLNDHYKFFCPFRRYDFVRKGEKHSELLDEAHQFIESISKPILNEYYPENIKESKND